MGFETFYSLNKLKLNDNATYYVKNVEGGKHENRSDATSD
jgi:hypothetical protein